jgi:GNAT superfamily N-acetyltransferase
VPYRTADETAAYFRYPPPYERRPLWVAGDIEGFAGLFITEGSDSAWLQLAVAAASRRRGLGRALFETAVAEARTSGCTALAGRHASPAGAAFAHALGATETRADVTSVLDLGSARLEVEPVAGYELLSWGDPVPDDLVESYAAARNAINDAPAANEGEQYLWTVDTVRGQEATLAERGREYRVTVAVDRSGEVAAFTELRLSPEMASVEDTATVAAHRGRGLAMWVKAESLRRLRAERPGVRLVTTTNAADNAPILAANRRLGFEPVATGITASIPLAQGT